MGEVAEACGIGDGADGIPTIAGTSQQIAGVQQSLPRLQRALLAFDGRASRPNLLAKMDYGCDRNLMLTSR
jgi:hypothetical protein